MKRFTSALLVVWASFGAGFGSAQERPVLAQEFRPDGARPGFWWTRREDEYTLQFFGTVVPRAFMGVTMRDSQSVPVQSSPPRDPASDARASFSTGNTIANLRGLDPSFGCRTLTLIDGRRIASQGSAPARSPPPAAVSPLDESVTQVWLLNRDGTIVMPQRKTPSDIRYCGSGIVYGFEPVAARAAVAVAFTVGEDYFIQQLQPFADEDD